MQHKYTVKKYSDFLKLELYKIKTIFGTIVINTRIELHMTLLHVRFLEPSCLLLCTASWRQLFWFIKIWLRN